MIYERFLSIKLFFDVIMKRDAYVPKMRPESLLQNIRANNEKWGGD